MWQAPPGCSCHDTPELQWPATRGIVTGMSDTQIERSSLEAYGGATLGVLIAVIPLHWQWQLILFIIIFCISIDVSWRGPAVNRWKKRYKLTLIVINFLLLIAIGWGPIHDQYNKDHQVISEIDERHLGQELMDLSNSIQAFHTDRAKQSPQFVDNKYQNQHDAFVASSQYRNDTNNIIKERFENRILSDVALLKVIGINPPWMVVTSMYYDSSIMGRWLGAMGRLLSEGKLKEAIETGSDNKLWPNLNSEIGVFGARPLI